MNGLHRAYHSRRIGRLVTGLLGVAVAAMGCATGGFDASDQYRGDTGPVNWEIVGIRTNITPNERQIQWNYTLILRETGGRTIQFETLETSAQSRERPDALLTGTQKQAFRVRLAPRSEYRLNMNYGLSFTAPATGGFGTLPGGRQGVLLQYRLAGQDEAGHNITVTIPVTLYPGAGTQVRGAAAPASSASPEVGASSRPPAPPAADAPAPASSSPNPARQAADECASHSKTLKILAIGEAGDVNYERAPGEEVEFEACYQSRLNEKMHGRLVEAPGGPVRTSVAIDPLGTSVVVEVTINTRYRARLLLDTGSTMTLIRPRLAGGIEGLVEIQGLRPAIIVASGDSVTITLARLQSFTVGDFEVEGLHVGVYDVAPQLADIDGLLGTDVLERFTINIDRGARRLTLERKP